MPSPYLPATAIILGITVLQIANGILVTILPVTLTEAGYSAQAFSLVATAHSVSFLLGCLFTKRVIQRVGHIRAFAVYAALSAVTAVGFAVAVDPLLWIGLRLVTGFCSAGLFTVAESWLNETAASHRRARLFAVYTIIQKVALAGGQFCLYATGGTVTLGLFMAASAFYSLALVPVALNPSTSPAIGVLRTLPIRRLYALAPSAVIGCVASGLVNSPIMSLGPIWGLDIGLDAAVAGALPAMAQIGNLLVQWPIGRLSDRVDRRLVIAGAGAVTLLLSLAVAIFEPRAPLLLGLLFCLWGGASMSVYAVCVAHANDEAPKGTAVAVSGTLLLAWGTGAVFGPLIVPPVMARVGASGLFYYAAAVAGAMVAFTLWRMAGRPRPPRADRRVFTNVTATSPNAGELALGDGNGRR
jgi:MFS family permease